MANPPGPSRSVEELEAENAALRSRVAELEAADGRGAGHVGEYALRDSYELLHAVVENSPSIIFVKDPDGRYILVNTRCADGYEVPRDVLLGKTDGDYFPPEAVVEMKAKDEEARRLRAPIQFEESVPWRLGVRHYLTTKFPIYGVSGAYLGICGIATDITEQRNAEAARAAQQERFIAAQDAALRELSTPLMPIAEGVIAMPLVGAIDSVRADRIMSTLLDGIGRTRAHTAIIDITGVGAVDTGVANALIRSAQAARLLGARVVLTGIRPEVAETLVNLAADLRGVVTMSTLQSGIAYALAQR